MYAGCSALVIGCGVKAGVRFLSYDWYKSLLKDNDVRSSAMGWTWLTSRVNRASCLLLDRFLVRCELVYGW